MIPDFGIFAGIDFLFQGIGLIVEDVKLSN